MRWAGEQKFLIGCSVINRQSPVSQIARQSIGSNLDWEYILKNALENGTSCLLYKNLKQINEDILVPEWVIKKLEDVYFAITAENIFLLDELGKALKKFNQEGIPAIVLKGAALLENIYQDIGLRKMRDIDILVKKEQLDKIDKSLKQLGYSSVYNWADYIKAAPSQYLNSICYIKKQGKMPVILHLHWHIINAVAPFYLYGAIDIDRFWNRAIKAAIAGFQTLVLAPQHLLIHLSEHSLKHSYSHFILFCDIFEVIRYYYKNGLDWQLLVQETVEFNLNKPVYYGLYFTSKFLGAEIPGEVLTRLKPSNSNFVEGKIQALIENSRGFPDLNYLSCVIMNEKLIDKLKFALRSIFLPRAALALQYILPPEDIRLHHYLLKAKSALNYLWRRRPS